MRSTALPEGCVASGAGGPTKWKAKEIQPLQTKIASAAALAAILAFAAPARADHHMSKDIVDTAVAAGSFKTLAKALGAAGLVDTLKGSGPFTVFAPTDEAFAKLPAGALDKLLADKEKLKAVLLYHVVAGKVTAKDVVKLTSAKTVQGGSVTIAVKGDKVMVDGATVAKADVMASNGVIHVIDTVLMPK
jgi:uncharacterized surface protein with fasciclin (FAS1) repeats